jgi:TolB-like protein/DNA-binding winged helix-turn-helix (wHTH) protein/Tfp pilus assembly protein PilF
MQSKTSSLVCFGEYTFDPGTGELLRGPTPLKLQPQPAKVLAILIRRAGQVVTRQELVDEVWGSETFVDYEQGLNYAVRQIRTVLEDDADHPRFLETLPKRGYRFIAPLSDAVPAEELPPSIIEPATLAIGSKFPWRLVAACLALGVIAAALTAGLNWDRLRHRWWPAGGGHRIESLAVLPLHNLSHDPEQEYFSDGMTDQLITDLAEFGGLRVISHTSVERYKGTKRPLPEIARELDVDAVVEGTVTRSGDRVRITAQLIDARTDAHLWAETYQRDLRDVLALQDELSRDIAEEVRLKLTPEEQSRVAAARTVSPQAYDAYLRGRHLWLQRSPGAIASAIDYFQQAVREDPSFALAYSGLADCYWVGWGAKVDFPLAEQYARKAISLQPDLAEGYASLGAVFLYEHQMADAQKELRRAIELNPNYAMAHHYYTLYLLSMGLPADALAENERSRQLDPFTLSINAIRTAILISLRQYDRALEQARRFAELFPQSPVPYLLFERIYWIQGRVPEAIAERRKVATLVQSAQMMRDQDEVTAAFNKSGVRAARLKAAQLMERRRHDGGLLWGAFVYGTLQDGPKVLECLERARGQEEDVHLLSKTAPEFDFLHDDPHYQELLRRLNLPQ